MDISMLSNTQQKVLEYVKNYIAENHYSPTVRDICAGTGLKSTSTVHGALRKLNLGGFLTYLPGTRRAISLSPAESDTAEQTDIIRIPLRGNVAAGQPILAVENIQEYYPLPPALVHGTSAGDVFMMRIKGESMIEIGMYEDDLIIVNPTESITNGDIAVVRVDDCVTVKRITVLKDRMILRPENSSMSPIYVDSSSDVAIVGKVVGLIRNY